MVYTIAEKAIRFWHPDYNPDRAQKLISSSMSRHLSTRNISSKSMHAFLCNLANRQTDRQTRANAFTTSFVGGNKSYRSSFFRHSVVQNILKKFNCVSRVHNATYRQTTDGIARANIQRNIVTFGKKRNVVVFLSTVYSHIPTVEDVLYLWIGRVKVFKPLRKLGSSRHEVIEQFTRLKLTEVADS